MKISLAAIAASFTLLAVPGAAKATDVYGVWASTNAANSTILPSHGFSTTQTSIFNVNYAANHGMKSVVWLGGFSNSTCTFTQTDSWINTNIASVISSGLLSSVAAWQVADEPHQAECDTAHGAGYTANLFHQRYALIHADDTGTTDKPVLLSHFRTAEFDNFYSTTAPDADVLEINTYPCAHRPTGQVQGCILSKVTDSVTAATTAGWPISQIWGTVQAFSSVDCAPYPGCTGDNFWYLRPSGQDYYNLLGTWRKAGVVNLMAYSWDQGTTIASEPEIALQSYTDGLDYADCISQGDQFNMQPCFDGNLNTAVTNGIYANCYVDPTYVQNSTLNKVTGGERLGGFVGTQDFSDPIGGEVDYSIDGTLVGKGFGTANDGSMDYTLTDAQWPGDGSHTILTSARCSNGLWGWESDSVNFVTP